jgi:hypothetical protein
MAYAAVSSRQSEASSALAKQKVRNTSDKWGEFVITPALMLGMDDIILDRIAFGGVKELEELYSA